MTSTFIATLRHHSLSTSAEITVKCTLAEAKRKAIAIFGDGFREHEICIYERRPGFARVELVARKRNDERYWRT
jgi:hypothetical protein